MSVWPVWTETKVGAVSNLCDVDQNKSTISFYINYFDENESESNSTSFIFLPPPRRACDTRPRDYFYALFTFTVIILVWFVDPSKIYTIM